MIKRVYKKGAKDVRRTVTLIDRKSSDNAIAKIKKKKNSTPATT